MAYIDRYAYVKNENDADETKIERKLVKFKEITNPHSFKYSMTTHFTDMSVNNVQFGHLKISFTFPDYYVGSFRYQPYIRFTTNNWKTFNDCSGERMYISYNSRSYDITFPIYKSCDFEYAVFFNEVGDINSAQIWDNNEGNNYKVKCYMNFEGYKSKYTCYRKHFVIEKL